jgi:hypothetical protein
MIIWLQVGSQLSIVKRTEVKSTNNTIDSRVSFTEIVRELAVKELRIITQC